MRKDLQRLAALAAMLAERRIAEHSAAEAARAATEAHIAALAVPETDAGLDPLAAARAMLSYGRWADARRRDLTVTLARETAAALESRAAAAEAFGRKQVLDGLAVRGGRRPDRG